MAVKSQEELRETIDQATQAGETFSGLYYETFDKNRHKMSKFYSANATLLWNGNMVKGGPDKLMEFFTNLPSSEHTLHSLDCQPVTDQAIPGHKTILVIVEGSVKFDGHKTENFSQNFLLTVEGTVWKLGSMGGVALRVLASHQCNPSHTVFDVIWTIPPDVMLKRSMAGRNHLRISWKIRLQHRSGCGMGTGEMIYFDKYDPESAYVAYDDYDYYASVNQA